ncbi:50S ribosomal protein L24 [Candidatus Wolfebacteria bacterium]|nr:50S ribosomal protein L24 [Candidatus Wolfebacteria bacterium]
MKIRKNDTVKILVGKDKGKSGKVVKVFLKSGKILVENINLFKKHIRPKRAGEKGQIVEIPKPIYASKTALICHSCGKTTRIGCRFEGKIKTRICKKCQAKI